MLHLRHSLPRSLFLRHCQINNEKLVIKRKPSGTAIPAAIAVILVLEEAGDEAPVVDAGVGHVVEGKAVMADVTVALTLDL